MIKAFQLGWYPSVFSTNCYLVCEKGECVIIDPPLCRDNQLEEYIDSNNLKPLAVLLTHGHFDHCGGAEKLKSKYGIECFCHENDLSLAANAERNVFGLPAENCHALAYGSGGFHVGNFNFDIMPTAGHTKGSVCLVIGDVMFCGDVVFKNGIGRTDFAESDADEMKRSLLALSRLDKDFKLLCGHGEQTTLFAERRNILDISGL